MLKQVPIFKSLGQKDIQFLVEITRTFELPPDAILLREGERGDRLYIIADGDVDVIIAFGKPGELLLRVCGKGEPNQIVRVGHASPACKFSSVDIFGAER